MIFVKTCAYYNNAFIERLIELEKTNYGGTNQHFDISSEVLHSKFVRNVRFYRKCYERISH